MAAKKQENQQGLTYKGKPLLRRGNLIYYGNPDDKYIVMLTVQESTTILTLEVSSSVLVHLQTNDVPGRERVIKKAERDGLYSALDLGEFWLEEALTSQ
ncbi:MAG: hypothetical protein LBH54_04135 [Clostridiales bacterium]|jgi:hypothetical protein|nr:hypothetical protein [Clostridiales bacterium]